MTTLEDAVTAVARRLRDRSKRPLLICIDGFSGSGKSTLAGVMRSATSDVIDVVEGDDFYGPEEAGWSSFSPREGYEHFFDHERLVTEVLGPLSLGQDASYQRYDWQNNVLAESVDVRAQGVVVIEGVYMLRPQLREFWDLSIFVDTPWPIRLKRQQARGENTEADIKLWTDAEKYYEAVVDPASRADLVLPGH